MIKFGPSGNDEKFYADGFSKTLDSFAWLKNMGLELFEYSLGNGITLKLETAEKMGIEAVKNDIEVSVHAPYFINFANPSLESRQKSINYVLNSLKILNAFKGKKCVIHSGSVLKQERNVALDVLYKGYDALLEEIYKNNLNNFYICPETMGKYTQIGSYEEIIDLCTLDKCLIPTLDFGHINCVLQGSLKTEDDYRKIIDYSLNKLGKFKTDNLHIHFSKIEYSKSGEIKHLDLSDETYGPKFEPLARVLKEYNLNPTVICESKGKMATDALILKNIYKNL
ncbi:MAG: endonuclease IV [Clostridiales bacterium]|nr:endonuclease IV [Clostridiales bacterium]